MKNKLNFKGNCVVVDFEMNKLTYGRFASDTESFPEDPVIEFYLSKREQLLSMELLEFLGLTGIDWMKENEIFYYSFGNQVIVEGWYDIIGELLTTNDKPIYWEVNSCTTNIYVGDKLMQGMRAEFKETQTIRIEFAIVIPNEILGISTTFPN